MWLSSKPTKVNKKQSLTAMVFNRDARESVIKDVWVTGEAYKEARNPVRLQEIR